MRLHRRFTISALLISNAATLAFAINTDNQRNPKEFDFSLAKHLQAIDTRDWKAFESTLTTNSQLVLITPNGNLTTSTSSFKEQMRAWFSDPDWTWTHELVNKHNDDHVGIAVIRVKYQDIDSSGHPISLNYLLTLVFKNEKQGWRLVHDQNTLLKNN